MTTDPRQMTPDELNREAGKTTYGLADYPDPYELTRLRAELAKRDAMHVVLDTPHDVCDDIVEMTIGEAVKQYGEQCLGWTFPDTYSVLRTDLLALRETVRVLGRATRLAMAHLDCECQSADFHDESCEWNLIKQIIDASPGARAAVENAQ